MNNFIQSFQRQSDSTLRCQNSSAQTGSRTNRDNRNFMLICPFHDNGNIFGTFRFNHNGRWKAEIFSMVTTILFSLLQLAHHFRLSYQPGPLGSKKIDFFIHFRRLYKLFSSYSAKSKLSHQLAVNRNIPDKYILSKFGLPTTLI